MTRAGDGRKHSPSVVLVGLALVLWSALYAASAEARRIALVIGNGDYARSGDLRNPANDARAIADKLESLDFTLVGGQAHVDVNRRDMDTLFRTLEAKLKRTSGVEAALVYYSGHGVAEAGQNWLVPVDDGAIEYRDDVPAYAIGANDVMERLERGGGRLHILILDACRNNELPSRQQTKGGAPKGLLPMPTIGKTTDQMIVYAAADGAVAYDGQVGEELSPFAKALVDEMDEPGRRLMDVVGVVKGKLRRQTAGYKFGTQVPWVYSSIERPFYFKQCSPGSDCPGQIVIIDKIDPIDYWKDFEQRKECDDCPLMVAVPAGSFKMGDDKYKSELPIRSVNIGRLAVGVHEVTFSQWDACHRAGGCSYKPKDNNWGRGNRPVIDVSWKDAQDYVGWLSKVTGKNYRLPSESEWEYVARAETTGPFHTGPNISRSQANFQGSRTVAVGSFPESNRFGLHDVHGNVWEWVEDCWHPDYHGAPVDGGAWTRGGDCGKRVFRGGSWENQPEFVRSAYRWGGDDRLRSSSIGFRVARTLN